MNCNMAIPLKTTTQDFMMSRYSNALRPLRWEIPCRNTFMSVNGTMTLNLLLSARDHAITSCNVI